jgi:hypothetical protein
VTRAWPVTFTQRGSLNFAVELRLTGDGEGDGDGGGEGDTPGEGEGPGLGDCTHNDNGTVSGMTQCNAVLGPRDTRGIQC